MLCSDEASDDEGTATEHEATLSRHAGEIHLPDIVQHIPALRQTQQVAA